VGAPPLTFELRCRSESVPSVQGVHADVLRTKYGHSLTKLLDEAQKNGLCAYATFTIAEEEVIAGTNDFYDVGRRDKTGKLKPGKRVQYFDPISVVLGHPGLPDLRPLKRITRRLIHNDALEKELLK
jgi:hypothetical protein